MEHDLGQTYRRNEWGAAALAVLPWIVAAFTSLYLKYRIMEGTASYNSGGFVTAAESLGRPENLEVKFSFFRMDLLLAFLIVPMSLVVIARLLPTHWRLAAMSVLSAGVTVALVIQLRAFEEVGQFLSLRTFWTALSWASHEPRAYARYIHFPSLALGTVALVVAVCVVRRMAQAVREVSVATPRSWAILRLGGSVCVLLVLLLPWMPRVLATPYHQSALVIAVRAYWHDPNVNTQEFAGLTTPQLLHKYREFTGSPTPNRDPSYWGKAKGSNVLFFVFETMPSKFLPPYDTLDDLPNLRRLRDRSFIGLKHHTTFPRTHEAVFSLLSSWYPSDLTRTFEEQQPAMQVPGIMRILSARGYYTTIFSPMKRWHSYDEEMFQSVGVMNQVYPPNSWRPPTQDKKGISAWERTRVARDLATLDLMKRHLDDCLSQRRNFAGVFLPQIGHMPYPDGLGNNESSTDLKTRARKILQAQDAYLGQLLQVLDQHGQLKNTVIVVVGDHGIRTREEDPSFNGGVEDYSFHVPLYLYAPQALDRSVEIPWLTSHIDVAPSVLDLLGVEDGRQFEEGTAIWNPGIEKRGIFFLANILFGTDGYASGQRFYMTNHMSESVYTNSSLTFNSENLVPKNSFIDRDVPFSISRLIAFQEVLITHFGQTNAIRNHLFDR